MSCKYCAQKHSLCAWMGRVWLRYSLADFPLTRASSRAVVLLIMELGAMRETGACRYAPNETIRNLEGEPRFDVAP
jgi:hypothetical protein